MTLDKLHQTTRASWNTATRAHNDYKGDQARFLREGGDTLFPEELDLLGDFRGKTLLHLQCNSGQDSLCLAKRGANVTGVDFSDEAIHFARKLSEESGISARFEEAEIITWLHTTKHRFDIAFASYGVLYWHQDLLTWFQGVHRVLKPGGRLILVEFHPVLYSVDSELRLTKDDYFASEPFISPVQNYVEEAGLGLLHGIPNPSPSSTPFVNDHPAYSYQHPLGRIITSLVQSKLQLLQLEEWPYSNGCRCNPALVAKGRQWVWPPGTARIPLMFGLVAKRNR